MSVKPYRVLSLDGGGMRGLYTAAVLQTLAQRFGKSSNKDIGKGFQLVVGTSTGGIQACGLAAGTPIDDIINIYSKDGKRIFTNPKPSGSNDSEKLLNKAANKFKFVKKILWILKILNQSANSNKYLKEVLKGIFKEETMGDLYKRRIIRLCIPALELINCGPKIFRTPHSSKIDSEKNIDAKRKMADVCLATSATPIIFPVASILEPNTKNTQGHFIDGGLWANNPTLIGLIEALELSQKNEDERQKQKIEIISIGTSPPDCGEPMNEDDLSRGIVDWNYGLDIVELAGKAQSLSVKDSCESLEKSLKHLKKPVQVCRLTSSLSSEQEKIIGLDQTSKEACDTLIALGTEKGEEIYQNSLANPNDENSQMLDSIFSTLPDLPKKAEIAK